ncbi:MAG: hypothetical protein F6K36_29190 [Symploca sp. SIO3C6]|uniref:Uncharacterized protein n=1 Tax=Symploca sp. SIO1C4 TaxID=2607765 RepID=A0A6B3NAB8_9CYAN|nr:hypothetical protein [Symploca sp. SIO3C6]NER27835.1 hypothetical protein [Symploca sp. SIO1C4]
MEKSISPIVSSEPDNKCPGCFYMELDGNSVKPEKYSWLKFFNPPQTANEQITLYLTINFNEQWESLGIIGIVTFPGRVKFGLKSGELKFKLKNGEIPYEDRQWITPLDVEITKERQEQKSSKNKIGLEPSLASDKAGIKASLGTDKTESKTDKFQFNTSQISTKGSRENPVWSFEVETGAPILKGMLGKTELGTVTVTGKPCYVEATFEVSRQDIKVTNSEGPWLKELIPEVRASLDIAIITLLLKHKVQPYLSRVELQYV